MILCDSEDTHLHERESEIPSHSGAIGECFRLCSRRIRQKQTTDSQLVDHWQTDTIRVQGRSLLKQIEASFCRPKNDYRLPQNFDMDNISCTKSQMDACCRHMNRYMPYCLNHLSYTSHGLSFGKSNRFPMTGSPLGPGGKGNRLGFTFLEQRQRMSTTHSQMAARSCEGLRIVVMVITVVEEMFSFAGFQALKAGVL